jgi:four helix bundle protein
VDQDEMKQRTKLFALGIIQLVESLPKERTAGVLGGQLLRSGTSVGSNYRSACRAKSIADFISKMGIVEEEADESSYWMELLIEAGIEVNIKMKALMKEAEELLAITVASIKTARKRKNLSRRGTNIGQILAVNSQSEIRNPK